MRSSLLLKVGYVAGISFVTWFVTSGILARNASARAQAQAGQTPDGEKISKTIVPAGEAAGAKGGGDTSRIVAKSHLETFQVTADGPQVKIFSSVSLMNKHRAGVYMWRLRAYQDGLEVAQLDTFYKDQIFEVPPSGLMNPTFTETIQLPQGKHRVQLTLHHMEKGYDLNQMIDEHPYRTAIMSAHKTIEIK